MEFHSRERNGIKSLLCVRQMEAPWHCSSSIMVTCLKNEATDDLIQELCFVKSIKTKVCFDLIAV